MFWVINDLCSILYTVSFAIMQAIGFVARSVCYNPINVWDTRMMLGQSNRLLFYTSDRNTAVGWQMMTVSIGMACNRTWDYKAPTLITNHNQHQPLHLGGWGGRGSRKFIWHLKLITKQVTLLWIIDGDDGDDDDDDDDDDDSFFIPLFLLLFNNITP